MPNEIEEAGYVTIRTFIIGDWEYIELRDDEDSPILRLGETDPRVDWIEDDPNEQVITIQIVVSGDDPEITLPQTFAVSALFNVDVGGDALAVEEFTEFTMTDEADQLTVQHSIEVPAL